MVRAFPEMSSRPPGPERYAWARAAVFAGHTAREAVPDLRRAGRRMASRSRRPRGSRVRRVRGRRAPRRAARRRADRLRQLVLRRPRTRRRRVVRAACASSVCRPIRPSRCPFAISSCRSRRLGSTNPTTRRRPPATASGRSSSHRTVPTRLRPGWPSCRDGRRCTPPSARSTTGPTCSPPSSTAWRGRTSTSS